MRITVVGTGYVGLVSGACFADFGHHVTCVDKDRTKIEALKRGEMPIFEPGLAELVEHNYREGRLGFSTEFASAVRDAEVAVVSNPEFLREGAAIRDFKHPDRIVVGTEDLRAKDVMAALYRPLYLNAAPILSTGRRTAELIKYAANAFLAT